VGLRLSYYACYIERQRRKAFEDGAPLNAIYERDGVWQTFDDLEPVAKREIETAIAAMKQGK
jgi:hypothetical protein